MSALTNMTLTRPPLDLLETEILNHCIAHRTSFLCAAVLEEDRELKVHQSAGGWYIGVVEDTGDPSSRDSQYFPTQGAAQAALDARNWEQRMDPC